MEPLSKTILLGMATTGQTITRSTSISIALVILIIGATITITTIFNNLKNDMANMQLQISEIQKDQEAIFEYIKDVPRSSLIDEDTLKSALNDLEVKIVE